MNKKVFIDFFCNKDTKEVVNNGDSSLSNVDDTVVLSGRFYKIKKNSLIFYLSLLAVIIFTYIIIISFLSGYSDMQNFHGLNFMIVVTFLISVFIVIISTINLINYYKYIVLVINNKIIVENRYNSKNNMFIDIDLVKSTEIVVSQFYTVTKLVFYLSDGNSVVINSLYCTEKELFKLLTHISNISENKLTMIRV